MKLNLQTNSDKLINLSVEATGLAETEAALRALAPFVPGSKADKPTKDAYGNTIITMDNMAEALAILCSRGHNSKRSKMEFVKFIKRINPGMSAAEAKNWVDAHFQRWF